MTKREAKDIIKQIQSGKGANRGDFPEEMKGNIAKRIWNDSDFSYGFEYGAIYGLMIAFDLEKEDLNYLNETESEM